MRGVGCKSAENGAIDVPIATLGRYRGVTPEYFSTTFALDKGDVGLLLPDELGIKEGDQIGIEKRIDGVIVITLVDEPDDDAVA